MRGCRRRRRTTEHMSTERRCLEDDRLSGRKPRHYHCDAAAPREGSSRTRGCRERLRKLRQEKRCLEGENRKLSAFSVKRRLCEALMRSQIEQVPTMLRSPHSCVRKKTCALATQIRFRGMGYARLVTIGKVGLRPNRIIL